MAINQPIGIKFKIRDWKKLFQNDTWFMWERPIERMEIVLKRFTIWNVLAWYLYQLSIKIVVLILYPVLRLAFRYWTNIEEGQNVRIISEKVIRSFNDVYWFVLEKEKATSQKEEK